MNRKMQQESSPKIAKGTRMKRKRNKNNIEKL